MVWMLGGSRVLFEMALGYPSGRCPDCAGPERVGPTQRHPLGEVDFPGGIEKDVEKEQSLTGEIRIWR